MVWNWDGIRTHEHVIVEEFHVVVERAQRMRDVFVIVEARARELVCPTPRLEVVTDGESGNGCGPFVVNVPLDVGNAGEIIHVALKVSHFAVLPLVFMPNGTRC